MHPAPASCLRWAFDGSKLDARSKTAGGPGNSNPLDAIEIFDEVHGGECVSLPTSFRTELAR
jgi:hypothetical protein